MPNLMVIKAEDGQDQTYTAENMFLNVNEDDLLWIRFEKLKLNTETDEKLLKITRVQEIINEAQGIGRKLSLDEGKGIFVHIPEAVEDPQNWQHYLQQLINQQLQTATLQVPDDPSKYAKIEHDGDKFKLKLKTPQRKNSQIDLQLTAKQQSLLQSIQKFFPYAALTKISSSTPAGVGIVGDAKETNKQAWELTLNNADSTEVYKFHLSGEDYKNASIYETDGSPLEHIKSDADGAICLESLITENETNVITELQRIARLVILAVATGRDTIPNISSKP